MIDLSELVQLDQTDGGSYQMPNYVKIYDLLYNEIRDHGRTGDVLPSENAMANYWKVSRSTVRIALNKLEEDGYINKGQGRRATVAAFSEERETGINFIFNPCLHTIQGIPDRIQYGYRYQPCSQGVANEMGVKQAGFLVISNELSYYLGRRHIAQSVIIFDVNYLKQFQVDLGDKTAMKKFVSEDLFRKARRARSKIWSVRPETATYLSSQNSDNPILMVEDILLYENDQPLAYCKHYMDGECYRFVVDRKSMI
ncbi:MAG: GntR family transcriptional regulator [Clostridiales bacterium]|nr:GntR family transcriptional regulator [Clostridiales bacterium]